MPTFNSSNPWARSRSQPPPPSRNRRDAPPPAPAASVPSSRPRTPPGPSPSHPVDERTQAFGTLAALAARFAALERDLRLPHPSDLEFSPKASSSSPKLAFTPSNAPVHGYEEALTRLLTELDAVDSGGDLEVRGQRKALVKAVEGEAQRVERWRRDCWEARERGEIGPVWVKASGDQVPPPQPRQAEHARPAANGARKDADERERAPNGQSNAWARGPPPTSQTAEAAPSAHAPRRPLPGQLHPSEAPSSTGSRASTRPHPDQQHFRAAPGARPAPSPSRAEPRFAPRSHREEGEEEHNDGYGAWQTAPPRRAQGQGQGSGQGARWGSRNPYSGGGGGGGVGWW